MIGHTNTGSGTKPISNINNCAITVEYPVGYTCILTQSTRIFEAPSGGTSYTFHVDYGTWEATCSNGTFEYKDSVTVNYGESAKLILGKFLILESPSSFTLTPGDGTTPGKDGTLEYSTNASTWIAWDEVAELTAGSYHDKYVLYLRGTGNTILTGDGGGGSVGNRGWHITGSNVTVKGNIATLLDWQTVVAGSLPTISRGAFAFLFGHATNSPGTALKYAHELVIPYNQLSNICCGYMFYSQSALVTAPKLPAVRFGTQVYASMFAADSALVEAPALPATTLSTNCYRGMFNNCTSLITLPALPATELPAGCYYEMFKGATQIALSTSQTAAYKYSYTIPARDSVVSAGDSAAYQMFTSTGGAFTGTPSFETKYWVKNEVISI